MSSNSNHDSTAMFNPLEHLDNVVLPNSSQSANDAAGDMAFIDWNSDAPLPTLDDSPLPPPPQKSSSPVAYPSSLGNDVQPKGRVWLNGDVLMCACPDCKAPMSIRLWLMIADCWMCGISIELDEELEREARKLLAEREAAQQREHAVTAKIAPPPPARSTDDKQGQSPAMDSPKTEGPARNEEAPRRDPDQQKSNPRPPTNRTPRRNGQPSLNDTIAAPPTPNRRRAAESLTQRRIRQRRKRETFTQRIGRTFNDSPAWLVSLIFHLVLLTLLALFLLPHDRDPLILTLSADVDPVRETGGVVVVEDEIQQGDFDLPVPEGTDLSSNNQREALYRADQDARELRVDPETVQTQMADINEVKAAVAGKGGVRGAFAARDPRIRAEMVKKEGGTTLTEAAVARALRWLAKVQARDGHWSLDGSNKSDSAGTSLALMPYLGAGQTHLVGRYKGTVSAGLKWLIDHQKENGDLRANSARNAGMYAHGQSAIVLCEAFMLTGDETLRDPAQRAIDFIVDAQYRDGGWRYNPRSEDSRASGDTSVVGWQLMALQSARAADLSVPEESFELASAYLDSVQSHDGARYAYMRSQRRNPTHVMTAEALLCRMYLGWTKSEPGLRQGTDWLMRDHLPSTNVNIYYCYYATQTFHHMGDAKWNRWNKKMRDILVDSQVKTGRDAGSWLHRGGHGRAGGRVYCTALSACTLEVYYRHLPIFRQIDLK